MTMHVHVLNGCSPAPLASYLKALGILRLVSEQADREARGWWDGERFCVLTTFSRQSLEEFFLNDYQPTPLLSPWNKGSGFFKVDDPGLRPLEISHAPRFARFRMAVEEVRRQLDSISRADAAIRAIKARTKTNRTFQTEEQREVLQQSEVYRSTIASLEAQLMSPNSSAEKRIAAEDEIVTIRSLVAPAGRPVPKQLADRLKASPGYKRLLAAADRQFAARKAYLIPNCKLSWRGPHSEWLAAAVVIAEDGSPQWPSLLGTGGNDGNLDFTNNFMQQLGVLFDLETASGTPQPASSELLENSLWLTPANRLENGAIGQYHPGAAGGANSSTAFDGGNLVNAWDFVLMLEGSLTFTASATRKLDPQASARASAPFAVRPHAAGYATSGAEKALRGEQWMPLWAQPATFPDVLAAFGEARVQLGRQTANQPVDMARAISRLGVARGISTFVRYGYLERNGQSTLAVPLGRVRVRQHPRSYLVDDLAGWLNRIQQSSRETHAPARLEHAERRLANAVFAALTHDHTPERWQAVLLAAADIEALQAAGTAIEAGPLPPLRPEWIEAVYDGTPEVRLALALGSSAAAYTYDGRPIDSVRSHWLPLEAGNLRFRTADKRLAKDPRVVAQGRDPVRDLIAVVERRLIEAEQSGKRSSGLVAAPGCSARLVDISRFVTGAIDLNRLITLTRAFMAIRWNRWVPVPRKLNSSGQAVDEAWLAIRLACLPWALAPGADIPADPRIVRLLATGDATRAVDVACGRLRTVGIRPPLQVAVTDPPSARLWAAALAFPIDRRTAQRAAVILDPSWKGPVHA
jgi:CRISPR-associated protein Csx17